MPCASPTDQAPISDINALLLELELLVLSEASVSASLSSVLIMLGALVLLVLDVELDGG